MTSQYCLVCPRQSPPFSACAIFLFGRRPLLPLPSDFATGRLFPDFLLLPASPASSNSQEHEEAGEAGSSRKSGNKRPVAKSEGRGSNGRRPNKKIAQAENGGL
mmetsp:Transcript_50789/g.158704  ORF Transcript_50789/g.158704 Transcript_50789/m.158704 type:complete len:104 (+) Transcript_50789:107-418(+)